MGNRLVLCYRSQRTQRRINGHIMICYMNLYLLRVIEQVMNKSEMKLCIEKIIEQLNEVRAIKIETGNKITYLRTAIIEENNEVFRTLSIKIPSMVLSKTIKV